MCHFHNMKWDLKGFPRHVEVLTTSFDDLDIAWGYSGHKLTPVAWDPHPLSQLRIPFHCHSTMNSLHICSVTEMSTIFRSFQLNSHRIWSRDGGMGGLLVEDKKRPKSWLMCSATEKGCGRRERVAKSLDSVPEGFKGQLGQTLCPCCSRRSVLTSLGVALASTVGVKKSLSAGPTDLNAEAVRELVHPARPDWYEEFYAKAMDTTMGSYEAQFHALRTQTFPDALRSATVTRSLNWDDNMLSRGRKVAGYKKQLFHEFDENMKTVMELGIGTGPNLMYYGGRPSVSKVVGVDPNEKMAPYAQAAASAVGLQPSQFQFLHAVGEGLPLPDASVDAVVCTLVLCSVSVVSSTLKEVQRVLRPGGAFLFVEHVAAREGEPLRFWQNLLDPVQQLVADGCHLTHDTLSLIEAAQFASVSAHKVHVEGASIIGPHVIGIARTA